MLLSVRSTVTSIGSSYDFKGLGLVFPGGVGMGGVAVSPVEVRGRAAVPPAMKKSLVPEIMRHCGQVSTYLRVPPLPWSSSLRST